MYSRPAVFSPSLLLQQRSSRADRREGRERAIVNQTNIGTVSKATLGKFLRQGGAHMGFTERLDNNNNNNNNNRQLLDSAILWCTQTHCALHSPTIPSRYHPKLNELAEHTDKKAGRRGQVDAASTSATQLRAKAVTPEDVWHACQQKLRYNKRSSKRYKSAL